MKANNETMDITKISKNLKRIRKDKGLSKSDLVSLTKLDYHTLVKIESGQTPDPRISTIIKIAKALKEPIGDLIK